MNSDYYNLFGLILNLLGAILLAFSIEIYDPSKTPGVSVQILGHNLTTTTINKKRFNWGIGFLIAGAVMQIFAMYLVIYNPSESTQATNRETVLLNEQNCAGQASKAYAAEGFGGSGSLDITSYINHYNQKLNKCFIEIYDHGSSLYTISLIDAYELREYASLMTFYAPRYNNGGPNPVCDVDEQMSSVSARADCNSQADFERYVKSYMEN